MNKWYLSKLVEPSEEFTVQSEWNSRWVPKLYDRDEQLIVGQQQEYLFHELVPGWLIRYMARHRIDCPALIFYGKSLCLSGSHFFELTCEILEIHNKHYGNIKSIQVNSFSFDICLESGKSLIVNTEELPGAIWNEDTKEWSKETQNNDWSMSVKLRIVDRDPQKIFGMAAAPKPFCTEICSPDVSDDALHNAANTGDVDTVRQLIDKGVNVNRKNGFGDTALFRAARQGNAEIVRLLLEAGAKPNTQNHTGWGPLHTVSTQGYKEIIEMLLAAGAYVDVRNKNGWTPLFLAAGSGHLAIVQALWEANADIHAEDINGCTPILNAQKNGYQDVAKLLKMRESENGD